MKNFILLFTIAMFCLNITMAQTPAGFKYQAILRNTKGEIISNENVALKISIISHTEEGEVVYSEEHQTSTTELGLIVLSIGEGDVLSGTFNAINWSETSNFMKIELNRDGAGYETMGIAPLLAVPYALHANTASNVDDADADPANEIQTLSLSENTLSLTNGGSITLPAQASPGGDISGEIDSMTVEKLKGREISNNVPANGQLLKWDEAQQKWMPADDGLGAEGTTDGVVSSVGIEGTTTKTMTLSRSSGLGALTATFNVDDADADPTNEIQTLSYSGDTLYLTNGGAINIASGGTGFSGDYNDLENKPVLAGDVSGELDSTVVNRIQGQNFSAGHPESGQVLKWNGSAWAPGSDATVGGSGVDGVVESISVTGDNTKTIILGLSSDAPSSSLNANFTDNVDDADADTTNEIQDLNFTGNTLTITGNASATPIDLSTYLNTDTTLNEAEVDAFVANNGYQLAVEDLDTDITNEIQSLAIDGDTILLSKDGGKVTLPAKGWGGASDEALFAVVNSAGDTVFAVYEGGVQIYVDNGSKAARNGFAVASRSAAKGASVDLLNITDDSVRFYIDGSDAKAARNGFAVASRSAAKGTAEILTINDKSFNIVLDSADAKAARNGFAVASRSAAKSGSIDIMNVTEDSVRIFIREPVTKGARNGFAVASRSAAKSGSSDVLTINADSTRIYVGDSDAGFGVENTSSGINERLMRLTEENYFIGHQTGMNIKPLGIFNSFLGYQAGLTNTDGSYNIFIGYQSGKTNLSGQWNTFLGYQAGKANSGSDNTFIGYKAGAVHTTRGGNVYIGSKAGENATNGEQNVLIGESAGSGITTANKNNYIGFQAGYNTTEGSSNVFIGNESGKNNKTGENNVFMGYKSGFTNDGTSGEGSNNIFIGYESGYSNTTGKKNSFIGYESGYSNTTGDYNVFIGNQAGKYKSTGWSNVMIGTYSYPVITPYGGNYNVMLGNEAGKLNNDDASVIIGDNAGRDSDGGGNVILGYQSAINNSGTGNLIAGYLAGVNNTGNNNVILGISAGGNNNGNNNVLIGNDAGDNATGSNLLYIDNTSTNDPLIYGEFDNDKLVLNADTSIFNGAVGIGASPTANQLYIAKSIFGGTASGINSHVALIENTYSTERAPVLALKIASSNNPTIYSNYLTFFRGDDVAVGAIEGDNSGGLTYKSGSADYAEYLPVNNSGEFLEEGDIVGITGGKISKETNSAEFVSAITTNPIVLGNYPGEDKEHLYEKVGFIGIVPVKVNGIVKAGNYIIASGKDNGTGIAVDLNEIPENQYNQIVGIAWESSENADLKLIKTAVGVSSWTAPVRQQQQIIESQNSMIIDNRDEIEKLKQENLELKQKLSEIVEMLKH